MSADQVLLGSEASYSIGCGVPCFPVGAEAPNLTMERQSAFPSRLLSEGTGHIKLELLALFSFRRMRDWYLPKPPALRLAFPFPSPPILSDLQ
jgi:hypothetical protein